MRQRREALCLHFEHADDGLRLLTERCCAALNTGFGGESGMPGVICRRIPAEAALEGNLGESGAAGVWRAETGCPAVRMVQSTGGEFM